MKKIEIVREDDFPTFLKKINSLLITKWKTKGDIVIDNGYHYMVFYKK